MCVQTITGLVMFIFVDLACATACVF